MNEAETRAEHVDPALAAAGWGVVEGSRVRREYSITLGRLEGFGRRGKPLSADYVLEYRNTKLGVVEAKAWDAPLTEGVAQAKDYAGKLAIRFAYATNGHGIYGIDMQEGTEGETPRYPTPDELWNRTFAVANAWRDRFAAVPFEDRGGYFQGRYYQDIAIERVLQAIAADQQRLLLTLATGTGKMFIAFQIAWKLFQSRWNLSREPTQDNEKTIPTILTTSQKLSTGVDARNIRNIVLMRPINSMIEFKQIIGRGTRLFDGKDYFTIYDFVKAHHHFSDPEWDGEPDDPATDDQGAQDVQARRVPADRSNDAATAAPRPARAKVKLADGKARNIQHMMVTTFWHPDGTPMSAQQFMEMLFGKLPDFFQDEAELRAIWGDPDTRAKLLTGLADKGFGGDQLAEMQKIIDAEKSDLFDVLAHVAFAIAPLTREDRAANAKLEIDAHFGAKQQAFLDFVLTQYVKIGVRELDREKLSPLLKLKYNNAIADLGKPEEISKAFTGFQKYLYEIAA